MGDKDLLFEIIDHQQGYFTSRQAEECGYSRSNFHLKLKSGEWIKEMRGIYRLTRYPTTERPELVLWSLWSADRKGNPQGIWSHETALDIYDLSDIMPSKMHMSVPRNFRRKGEIPQLLSIHYADIPESDIEIRQGYRITKPLRTLIDLYNEGRSDPDQLRLAIYQAQNRGLITKREFESQPLLQNLKNGQYL